MSKRLRAAARVELGSSRLSVGLDPSGEREQENAPATRGQVGECIGRHVLYTAREGFGVAEPAGRTGSARLWATFNTEKAGAAKFHGNYRKC